jgi:hypothetical protein
MIAEPCASPADLDRPSRECISDERIKDAPLFIARAAALATSRQPMSSPLDRRAADATISASVRGHGGIRGCAAALAQDFGDCPELAMMRMRWARAAVAAIYSPVENSNQHAVAREILCSTGRPDAAR